jgi:hypothetical protein
LALRPWLQEATGRARHGRRRDRVAATASSWLQTTPMAAPHSIEPNERSDRTLANSFDEMHHMLSCYAGVYAYDDLSLHSNFPVKDP